MRPKTLDHVAFWVADRDRIAQRCISRLGMHVIDRTDRFTLVGADARRGKLTLFDAEGPREPGALKHVALRVSSLPDEPEVDLGEGILVRLVEAETDLEYDLDHVALCASEPERALEDFARMGLRPEWLRVEQGDPGRPEQPLLNHIAVLVDSAAEAQELGFEVDSVVDAANTFAVFLHGPEGVRIEYVEHKPGFSLK